MTFGELPPVRTLAIRTIAFVLKAMFVCVDTESLIYKAIGAEKRSCAVVFSGRHTES